MISTPASVGDVTVEFRPRQALRVRICDVALACPTFFIAAVGNYNRSAMCALERGCLSGPTISPHSGDVEMISRVAEPRGKPSRPPRPAGESGRGRFLGRTGVAVSIASGETCRSLTRPIGSRYSSSYPQLANLLAHA